MSLLPFKGRCWHCGHDHGQEGGLRVSIFDVANLARINEQQAERIKELEADNVLKADASRRRTIRIAELEEQLAAANALIEQARPIIERLAEEIGDDYTCHIQEGGEPVGYSANEQEILGLAVAIERHKKGEK